MKFLLEINLDDDAMSDAPPIANALRTVADTLDSYYVGCDPIEATEVGEIGTVIRDFNGNTVGNWKVTEPETAEQIADRVLYDTPDGPMFDIRTALLMAARAGLGVSA